jgi:lipoprotein-releasing system permease protein
VGDKVFAYFFAESIRTRRFTIAGIYETNMTEFDKSLAMTDLYTTVHLNGWESDQTSGVELTVKDYKALNAVDGDLVSRVNRHFDSYGNPYTAMTIEELYPQIFAWLGLLDMNVWVILGLMICVAGFTMVSGLLIIILERTNFIGVMKALGATNRSIRHIFLHFAVFVIGRGLLWGNVLGIGIVLLQSKFGIFHLDPTTYYVKTVPVLFNGWLLLALNGATLLISVLVLILPSFLISNIHPAKSIRYE